MKKTLASATLALCAAGFAAVAPGTAAAQSAGMSFVPWTTNGYVGLNVGQPKYKLGCPGAFECDDPNTSFHVYTGGMFNPWLGLEAGYLYMGRADRAGGKTRGHGINVSVVGNLPITNMFRVFAKAGGTYSRTDVTADPLSLEPTGDESGFGPSYGAGVGVDFSREWGAVLEWERHDMKFAGRGREHVDNTSLGVVFRF